MNGVNPTSRITDREQLLTRLERSLPTKICHTSLHGVYVEGQLLLFSSCLNNVFQELALCLHAVSSQIPHQVCYPNLKQLLKVVHDRVRLYGTIHCIHNFHISLIFNFKNVMESSTSIIPKTEGEPWDIVRIKEYLSGITNIDFLEQLISDLLLKSPASPMEIAAFLLSLNQKQDCIAIQKFTLEEFEHLNESMKAPASVFISKVESILLENLSNPNLSLKWIAQNYLYMNVDYASRKILKESGKKFSSILTELRVQKAKALLLENSEAKMQTIADQVGYGNNPQYFSQIFKKNNFAYPQWVYKKDEEHPLTMLPSYMFT